MSTNSQFFSQQSDDLSQYLPSDIDFEDELVYGSADMLMHLIDFTLPCSGHRTDSDLFNSTMEDTAALSVLATTESYNTNYVNNYLHEQSRVVPHTSRESPLSSPVPMDDSNMSPPGSPLKSTSINIRKFLIFDEATGRERRPLLYEFIRLLLEDDEYSEIAQYIDRKQGIFKLYGPQYVSELWKHVKGRNSDNKMTYDKLARAFRHYYKSDIMTSCPGRFTFRFGPKSGFGTTWWPSCE